MDREAICDFPRSEFATPRALRSLETLHQGVAGGFGEALSLLLRSPVEVRFAGVDQLAYGGFVHGLTSPSYFAALKADPLRDCLMLDIELAILYPMLDRMLGGGREDEPSPCRAPSDIELPLAARIVRLFLEQLEIAWREVLPATFDVLQIESRPRMLRVVPSDELVAVLSFALTIGDRHGLIRLCFPSRAIRQIADKLLISQADSDADVSGVELVVTLANSTIEAADWRELQVGDILLTETDAAQPAVVSLDGRPKFLAKPGHCDGRKAVVLSQMEETSPS
jgi:flagellar motor switch protein FliM